MAANPAKYVVGIGELLWDVFPDRKVMGGAPANFAYHVSQFGLRGCAVSAVGCDADGDGLLELLQDKAVDTEVARVGFPTGRVAVTLSGEGIPCYEIEEGAAWDNIPWTTQLEKLAGQTGTVCFGTLAQRSPVSRNTITRFIKAMPGDSIRVCDINLRQHYFSADIISSSLSLADILKINDEELITLSSMFALEGSEADMCRTLIEKYDLSTVILTKGTDGSLVIGRDGEESLLPTPRVVVADTVGAGDSFTAAFTAALLNGKTLRDAHLLAVDTSAWVCSCHGAMPAMSEKLVSRVK